MPENASNEHWINLMAGTDATREMIMDGPIIILVEPQLGENIGMVARAMANFGLVELRLVNPRDGWPNEKAVSAASKANHVIAATRVFETLEDAIADLKWVYATTARSRDMLKPVRTPEYAAQVLKTRHRSGQKVGLLFGRERVGLLNNEIALADEIVTFPVNPAFASLNIAQAVLLMSYEWMKSDLDNFEDTAFSMPQTEPANKEDLVRFFEHLERALDKVHYFFPEDKRERMVQNLRTIFGKGALTQAEVKTLRGVVARFENNTIDRRNIAKRGIGVEHNEMQVEPES